MEKKEKCTFLFVLVFFGEMVYYLQIYRHGGKAVKYLFRKKLTDLSSENMLFFMFGSVDIILQLGRNNRIEKINILTTSLSFLSCIFVIIKLYIYRLNSGNKFKKKEMKDFGDFPYEL